jgi:hypothetical protein
VLALARNLKHGAVMPGWNWTGWFVAIVDQHGHKVDEVYDVRQIGHPKKNLSSYPHVLSYRERVDTS